MTFISHTTMAERLLSTAFHSRFLRDHLQRLQENLALENLRFFACYIGFMTWAKDKGGFSQMARTSGMRLKSLGVSFLKLHAGILLRKVCAKRQEWFRKTLSFSTRAFSITLGMRNCYRLMNASSSSRRYGKFGSTAEEIEAAAKSAQMHERIMGFPDGKSLRRFLIQLKKCSYCFRL